MTFVLKAVNHKPYDMRIISSDIPQCHGHILKPNSELITPIEIPEGLKVFSRYVTRDNQPHLWVGFVDEDAFITGN